MIWIIGAGAFGQQAARRLDSQHITLVDPDPEALEKADMPGLVRVNADGPAFLAAHLHPETQVDWIVPALPRHLAWEWARLRLGKERLFGHPLPRDLVSSLPNAMAGATGDLYASHADFICPPNCNEPDDCCTRTGKPRKEDLFRLLARLGTPVLPAFVIQSHQLGPGLGGYRPQALFELAGLLEAHQGPCFVATACRCHGVVSGGIRL